MTEEKKEETTASALNEEINSAVLAATIANDHREYQKVLTEKYNANQHIFCTPLEDSKGKGTYCIMVGDISPPNALKFIDELLKTIPDALRSMWFRSMLTRETDRIMTEMNIPPDDDIFSILTPK